MNDDSTLPTLGFVGTGTITSAIVTGLCSEPSQSYPINLSPRNENISSELASRFAQVRVADSNQAVVDGSDVVFLAVRPQVAVDVAGALRFRPDHHVVSLVATFSKRRIASLVAPAHRVTCAVPQPTVAARRSPTAIFPPDPFVAALFARLGAAFEASTEAQFRALFATTAAMATFFTLLDTLATWLSAHEIDPSVARDYVSRMFAGLADVPARSSSSFAALAAEFKTRGGLNEQFANELDAKGAFGAAASALDKVLKRIVGSARER